jgi:hypothetical protein
MLRSGLEELFLEFHIGQKSRWSVPLTDPYSAGESGHCDAAAAGEGGGVQGARAHRGH